MARAKVAGGGVEGFFEEIREDARKLDGGEMLPEEITLRFEDPRALVRVLTAQRVQLLRRLRVTGSMPITALAAELRRDKASVSRDVQALERAGTIRTRLAENPGHGNRKIVEPRAKHMSMAIY
jgi:predicted transcriptional regulator